MRFDDRLKTVLAQPATNAHDRAVRWRQLVELLARTSGQPTVLSEQALADIRSETDAVGEQLRAATARAIARPQLPLELVQLFAADNISVSAPVLAAASLDPEEWKQVFEVASPESRRFLRALHPNLPEPETPEEPVGEPAPAPVPAAEPAAVVTAPAEAVVTAPAETTGGVPSITEMVARIERLRQARQTPAAEPPPAPQPEVAAPPSAPPALFRWECGPSGEIAWVDGVPRGALIGRSLASPGEYNGLDERVQRAFAVRAPFRDARLVVPGEGVAAGEWKLSGVPAFEPSDGRFAGYRGVATRAGSEEARTAAPQPQLDHDALRELVHEIKTPLNAIIGFAEIIDGQYLGPADHVYRERAADIVAQARLLLAAIEDLDLAAQLRSVPAQAQGSTDLKEVITAVAGELKERASRRGADLGFTLAETTARCGIDRNLAERLVRRFCGAIVDSAAPGERLTVLLTCDVGQCQMTVDRPQALRGAAEAEIFAATGVADQQGPGLATGFSLRLARTLAQVAGGDLRVSADKLTLILHREPR